MGLAKRKQGFVIQNLEEIKDGLNIFTKDRIVFDKAQEKHYRNIFKNLVSEGYIDDGNFDDIRWHIINKSEDLKGAYITYNYDLKPELNLALKTYFLVKCENNKSEADKIAVAVSKVQNMLNVSNCFSKENIDEFREFMNEYIEFTPNNAYTYALSGIEFISFYEEIYDKEYYDLFMSVPKPTSKSRELPPFKDIFAFDDILKKFFNEIKDVKLKKKYFPLFIWWNLTNVIPMRTGEFIRLRIDCVYEENNKFFIRIPRIKLYEKNKETKVQIIEITEQMFNMIKTYSEQVGKNEAFLFNNNTHSKYFKSKSTSSQLDRDCIGVSKFAYILDKFYIEIINKKYNKKSIKKNHIEDGETVEGIVQLQGNDTRHFAIINMMLQGYNPLTIADMAGHESIYSQFSYVNHLKRFSEINAINIAESIAANWEYSLTGMKGNIDIINNTAENKLKAELALYQGKGKKIDEGVCLNLKSPFGCTDIECIFCNQCIPIVDIKNYIQLKNIVDKYREKIVSKINLQIELIKDMFSELAKSSYKDLEGKTNANEEDVKGTLTYFAQYKMLNQRLAKIEAVSLKLKEFENGGVNND